MGCWRVEGPLRGQGALNRPHPPWLLMWEELANFELPQGRFWEIAPSPFYRRNTWGPEKNATGQSSLTSPAGTFRIRGSETHSFQGWVPEAERQGRLIPSGCQPPVRSVGAQAPAAKMAGFLQQWERRQLSPACGVPVLSTPALALVAPLLRMPSSS